MTSSTLPYNLSDSSRAIESFVLHDGIKFHTVSVNPPKDSPIKGKVMVIHGWCEHSAMYYKLMETLSNQGYECFAFDQRGSGLTSIGKYRGRVGRTKTKIYTDLDKMIETAWFDGSEKEKEMGDDLPHILIGHSMGGGISLSYGVKGKYRNKISHIATTGPLIQLHETIVPLPWLLYAFDTIASWLPYYTVQTMGGPSTVTSVDTWKDYLGSEKLCQGIATLGQLNGMLLRGSELYYGDLSTINPKVKLLILHAENDNYTSLLASEKFIERVNLPSEQKEYVEVKGACHSLFIEEDKIYNKVTSLITSFIESN